MKCPFCNSASIRVVRTKEELRIGRRKVIVPFDSSMCDSCNATFVTGEQHDTNAARVNKERSK